MSVGCVEAEILPKWTFYNFIFSVFWDIDILASKPPTDVKVAPKCLFSEVLRYDIELYLRGGGTGKNL